MLVVGAKNGQRGGPSRTKHLLRFDMHNTAEQLESVGGKPGIMVVSLRLKL